MKAVLKFLMVAVLVLLNSNAFAKDLYPTTLDNGTLILVDGGMGVGRYADKNTVNVRYYAPPFYQIEVDVVSVIFSNDYYRKHDTYIDGPYKIAESIPLYFKYNWDTRTVFYQYNGVWKVWDLNRHYSHAEGNPMIPYAAEVAFVSAYNMKFFGDKTGYDGYRVIDRSLYDTLGI